MRIAVRGTAAEANASLQKGWVVGHFMPPGVSQSDDFEVKLWHYDENPDYPFKEFDGTELIIIYGGMLEIEIEESEVFTQVVLDGTDHEYVILAPGTKKQVRVLQAPAFGVTVRWPSSDGRNKVLGT